jgi:cytochrome c oxidase cbb3-type subunit 3
MDECIGQAQHGRNILRVFPPQLAQHGQRLIMAATALQRLAQQQPRGGGVAVDQHRLRRLGQRLLRAAHGDQGAASQKQNRRCAPLDGAGGGGATSYPNLNDDDWIWGGSLEAIQQTILYGVRSTHADTRVGAMPAFGQTGILNASEIDQLANHVRAIGGLPTEKTYDKALGDKIFGENCAACHGDAGKGKIELGAPNLSDKIWLFGSDKASIVQTLVRGRGSMMPAWTERLDGATIKALALYVHALGGGEPSP